MKKIINIEGMHCSHCEKRVTDALSTLENIKKVKVNLKKKEAVIESASPINDEIIIEAITKIGFEVINIK